MSETMTTTGTRDAAIVLGHNNYGKSEIRLVKVTRHADHHDLRDLTVDVALEGPLETVHTEGDNSGVVATDTMRNTVYALAADDPVEDVEAFGLRLVEHFLQAPRTTKATIRLVEHRWERISVGGRPHEHSFTRAAGGKRRAVVTGTEDGERRVSAGISDLTVLKTTNSGWENFLQDAYTSLPETNDRILATEVTARWDYAATSVEWGRAWEQVRQQMLETFTDHYSPSVQFTLFKMGEAVLKRVPEVERIHISMPNKHHLLYDLARFGVANDKAIYHATTEPYGLIEGTVERRSA